MGNQIQLGKLVRRIFPYDLQSHFFFFFFFLEKVVWCDWYVGYAFISDLAESYSIRKGRRRERERGGERERERDKHVHTTTNNNTYDI